jgi:hypothetical protein
LRELKEEYANAGEMGVIVWEVESQVEVKEGRKHGQEKNTRNS